MTGRASSPWVGLAPYTEEDRDYFHGRDRDVRIVAANLRARRLTVLYGSSGIGKSSLLLAGVVPTVREKRAVLVFRDWQDPAFLEELKRRCAELAGERGVTLDASQPLDELLAAARRGLGVPMLVVFDQFEEYFVAHPPNANGTSFEPELARAVNRQDVDAGFLISLREDALAGMDRFQARIPNLLRNLIRLEHLPAEEAKKAVRASIAVWNEDRKAAATVEEQLLDELVADVSPRATDAGFGGSDGAAAPAEAVEAPFLQLVLERLWEAAGGGPSSKLTLEAYERLGRARGIVAGYFDSILEGLTSDQRELCARFFDRLVTPSGGKISYPLRDLRQLAGDLAPRLDSTLGTLEEARILRRVDTGGGKAVEIYHDVLAPTIVEWQAELVRERRRAEERRRLRRRLAQIGVLVLALLAAVGYVAYSNWRSARPWATLADVGTGKAFQLDGSQVIVGRSVPGQKADVSFAPKEVSRVHVIVYRDGRAIDLRSTNGTTVNGEFVRYGSGTRQLLPGDVMVVGGIAVLRYDRIGYPFWHVWTPSPPSGDAANGWALLVSGRTVTPIVASDAYLSLDDDDGVVVPSASRAGALAAVSATKEGYSLDDLVDGKQTFAKCPESNGAQYPTYTIRDGESFAIPGSCVLIFGGVRAQVVPLATS